MNMHRGFQKAWWIQKFVHYVGLSYSARYIACQVPTTLPLMHLKYDNKTSLWRLYCSLPWWTIDLMIKLLTLSFILTSQCIAQKRFWNPCIKAFRKANYAFIIFLFYINLKYKLVAVWCLTHSCLSSSSWSTRSWQSSRRQARRIRRTRMWEIYGIRWRNGTWGC